LINGQPYVNLPKGANYTAADIAQYGNPTLLENGTLTTKNLNFPIVNGLYTAKQIASLQQIAANLRHNLGTLFTSKPKVYYDSATGYNVEIG
jgi:hypothetical protein